MNIKIDSREQDVLATMQLLFKEHSHNILVERLHLGDILLTDNENNEKIIFERKSLKDLASSIKDGRYKEQSYRLNDYNLHNHNIIYVIEGDLEKYNATSSRMDKQTLLSAMIALQFYKGFSLLKTKNINETCEMIISYANKLAKESKKCSFYKNAVDTLNTLNNESNENELPQVKYSEVCKKEKKNNITVENIDEIMLACIPSVSNKSATAIIEKFKSIKNLIEELDKNENCLNGIKLTTTNGKERNINKSCIENVKKFLLH